ncbi:hypothetical protein MBLNU457_7461t1 [Dothideomycetes sp. NU457]
MDAPPPYVQEDSKSSLDTKVLPYDGYAGQLDLRLQLRCGRAERIHVMADQVRKILESRALSGLSRSTLIFVPSGQDITEEDAASRIETMTDSKPLLVLLQDQSNSTEFWSQREVLAELRSELLLVAGVSTNLNFNVEEAELEVASATKKPAKKRAWFSRSSKPLSVSKLPLNGSSFAMGSDQVQVSLTEVYVRRESALGLLETVTVEAILVEVVLD